MKPIQQVDAVNRIYREFFAADSCLWLEVEVQVLGLRRTFLTGDRGIKFSSLVDHNHELGTWDTSGKPNGGCAHPVPCEETNRSPSRKTRRMMRMAARVHPHSMAYDEIRGMSESC